MSNLASAMTRLDEADRERVDVVFVTTDPARDTRRRCCGLPRPHFDPTFVGLTGDLDTIVDVAKPLGVGVAQGEKLPSGGYDITPRHHDHRRSTPTTRAPSTGARTPPPPTSPPTSTPAATS